MLSQAMSGCIYDSLTLSPSLSTYESHLCHLLSEAQSTIAAGVEKWEGLDGSSEKISEEDAHAVRHLLGHTTAKHQPSHAALLMTWLVLAALFTPLKDDVGAGESPQRWPVQRPDCQDARMRSYGDLRTKLIKE